MRERLQKLHLGEFRDGESHGPRKLNLTPGPPTLCTVGSLVPLMVPFGLARPTPVLLYARAEGAETGFTPSGVDANTW